MELKLISWFDDHFYKRETEDFVDYYPSVTSKLGALAKPELYEWYGRMGTREAKLYMNERADRGTRIHWAWYTLTTGGVVVFNPNGHPSHTAEEMAELKEKHRDVAILTSQDEMYQLVKLKKFLSVLKPEIIYSEKIVFNDSLREAGTVDNLFRISRGDYQINGTEAISLPEGYYIFDLKNTAAIYEEAKMQVSRYSYLEQLAGTKIIGALIGWTGSQNRKGIPGFGCIYLEEDDLQYWNRSYMHAAEIWRRHYSQRKPKIFEIPSYLVLENL